MPGPALKNCVICDTPKLPALLVDGGKCMSCRSAGVKKALDHSGIKPSPYATSGGSSRYCLKCGGPHLVSLCPVKVEENKQEVEQEEIDHFHYDIAQEGRTQQAEERRERQAASGHVPRNKKDYYKQINGRGGGKY